MATRIFTSFCLPHADPLVTDRVQYWVDVEEEYDKVFEQLFPLQPASSSLEARENFWYTKLEDGMRFAVHPQQVCGAEELPKN